MSCDEFTNDLLLHADGELEGEASLHLLAHLQSCAACTRRVYAHQQLKASITRVMGELKAPTALEAAVLSALEAADQPAQPAAVASPRVIRLYRPAAIAAVIALLATAGWQVWPYFSRSSTAHTSIHAVNVTDESDVAVKLATNAHKLHIRCAAKAAHHDPKLSTNADTAAQQLADQLGVPVLTGDHLQLANGKTRFDSAHLCALDDWADHPVAHLIYRDKTSEAISLMSMKTLSEIMSLKTRTVDGRDYAVIEPGISTKCHPFTIVAWSANKGSYVVCSPFGYEETMASVGPVRVALETGGPLPGLWLAAMDP